jgi:hypothetical protein
MDSATFRRRRGLSQEGPARQPGLTEASSGAAVHVRIEPA